MHDAHFAGRKWAPRVRLKITEVKKMMTKKEFSYRRRVKNVAPIKASRLRNPPFFFGAHTSSKRHFL